jgi:prolyl oligopeptidase
MPRMISASPFSASDPVTEIFHGVPVTDPYRWLEDQNAPRTRDWIERQRGYARAYLDGIPGRDRIRTRIRELLDVETYDSVQKSGDRYFFRKRLRGQEQPGLYMRQSHVGADQLLIDPCKLGTGPYTAVKLLRASPSSRLLLYEIKQGGERSGTFALFDVEKRKTLPDIIPRGYLRGFAFAPDEQSFYYSHQQLDSTRPYYRAIYHHVLGAGFEEDREVFSAGESNKIRLGMVSDRQRLGILVYRLADSVRTDFYLRPFEQEGLPTPVFLDADFVFGPRLIPGRILALTDRSAPNLRIVELRTSENGDLRWHVVVPESDARINQWCIVRDRIYVSYVRHASFQVSIFDLEGQKIDELPVSGEETIRFLGSSTGDELLFERESFTEPIGIFRHSANVDRPEPWARKSVPFHPENYSYTRVCYASKDGTEVPMFLLGKREVLSGGSHPTIMTSYGGHGVSMTPQFSAFVAYLVEHGCLFALPNIRGGAEFGTEWHQQAKRRNRQVAYDDFLCAAEWLIRSCRTTSEKLAIFGGSNSGLLVGAAMTQRPDLFRAVVCMVPLLDMLRYHLFDSACLWRDEFGTADHADDFSALAAYSPYHHVYPGVVYPATMIVSGDADGNCNPLHARKMTARLQAANVSPYPVILDYSPFRGHSPVLPLSERIEALTDRMAFLSEQLALLV